MTTLRSASPHTLDGVAAYMAKSFPAKDAVEAKASLARPLSGPGALGDLLLHHVSLRFGGSRAVHRSDGGVSRAAREMSAGGIVRMRPGRRALREAKNSFFAIQSYYRGTKTGLPNLSSATCSKSSSSSSSVDEMCPQWDSARAREWVARDPHAQQSLWPAGREGGRLTAGRAGEGGTTGRQGQRHDCSHRREYR